MGRRKFRLGRFPKNFERKCKGQRPVGRPCKQVKQSMSEPSSSETCASEPSNSEQTDIDTSSFDASSPSSSALSSVSSSNFISSSESTVSSSSSSRCRSCTVSLCGSCCSTSCLPSEDVTLPVSGLQSLITNLVLPTKHWIIKNEVTPGAAIYKLSDNSSSLVVTHCVRIKDDLTWTLSVHGVDVCAQKCGLLLSIPKYLCQHSLVEFLNLLDRLKVCPGHPDERFVEMVEAKKGRLMSKSGKHSNATVDSFSPVFVSGEEHANNL